MKKINIKIAVVAAFSLLFFLLVPSSCDWLTPTEYAQYLAGNSGVAPGLIRKTSIGSVVHPGGTSTLIGIAYGNSLIWVISDHGIASFRVSDFSTVSYRAFATPIGLSNLLLPSMADGGTKYFSDPSFLWNYGVLPNGNAVLWIVKSGTRSNIFNFLSITITGSQASDPVVSVYDVSSSTAPTFGAPLGIDSSGQALSLSWPTATPGLDPAPQPLVNGTSTTKPLDTRLYAQESEQLFISALSQKAYGIQNVSGNSNGEFSFILNEQSFDSIATAGASNPRQMNVSFAPYFDTKAGVSDRPALIASESGDHIAVLNLDQKLLATLSLNDGKQTAVYGVENVDFFIATENGVVILRDYFADTIANPSSSVGPTLDDTSLYFYGWNL